MSDKEKQADEPIKGLKKPRSSKHKTIIIAVSVIGVIVIGGGVAAGMLFATVFGDMHRQRPISQFDQSLSPDVSRQREQPQRRQGGGFNRRTINSANVVTGVVISVNGDSFVVAGNGKQVTVNKTTNTTFQGTATSVAVNDTVTVTGTAANTVFTATTIVVRNLTAQ